MARGRKIPLVKYIGYGLIVIGALLIWQIPLLGWFVGGMLVFIGLGLVMITRTRKMMKTFMPTSVKVCPECKAPIPGDASVCMHCGHRFDAPVEAQA
jgi:ribosomal protein L40E